jgi:hypothetical protein
VTATRYRKKPVVIEAMQWDGTPEDATPIIDWVLAGDGTARYVDYGGEEIDGVWVEDPAYIAIDTLEGTMKASESDMVIRGVKGEHYPCKPDIFAATYEPADA